MKKIKKIGTVLFISAYLLTGFGLISSALAVDQVNFTPQETIPGSNFQQGVATYVGKTSGNYIVIDLLARYISAFYNWGLSIVGVIGVLMLMIAGVIWITSGGDTGKIATAKKMISGSLGGMTLLIGAWFLLNTINPDLTNLKAIKIANVKNIVIEGDTVCCSSTNGEVRTSGGVCPDNYTICEKGESCEKLKDSYKCTDEETVAKGGYAKGSLCCEYQSHNAATNHLKCLTTSTTKTCPPSDEETTLDIYYTFTKSYPDFSCSAGILYADSCKLANACQGIKDGEECPGITQKYDGSYCYKGKCWFGLGDPGEPCGNDGDSYCLKAGSSCADKDLVGGRSCGKSENSFCCHSVK